MSTTYFVNLCYLSKAGLPTLRGCTNVTLVGARRDTPGQISDVFDGAKEFSGQTDCLMAKTATPIFSDPRDMALGASTDGLQVSNKLINLLHAHLQKIGVRLAFGKKKSN